MNPPRQTETINTPPGHIGESVYQPTKEEKLLMKRALRKAAKPRRIKP